MDRSTPLDLDDGSTPPPGSADREHGSGHRQDRWHDGAYGEQVYDQEADEPAGRGSPRRVDAGTAILPGGAGWRPDDVAVRRAADRSPAARPSARRPAAALVPLVLLALVATFFGWVSVEPFWLSLGRGAAGTATVSRCDGSGTTTRCEGRFVPAGGRWTAPAVDLSGVPAGSRRPGAEVPARMLDQDARSAYAGPVWGLHLRWGLGLALVLACGTGIAAATRVRAVRGRGRWRAAAVRTLSVLAPLLVFAGLLGSALV